MPKGVRSPDQRTVTFTAKKELISDIDSLAKADKRSRSNWLVKELTALVAQKRLEKNITMLPPADNPGKSIASRKSKNETV